MAARSRSLRSRLAPLALALFAAVTLGAGEQSDALLTYLAGLNSLSADFTQTVTDAHGLKTGGGSGSLQVQRPNRFRWDYHPSPASDAAASASGGGTSTGGTDTSTDTSTDSSTSAATGSGADTGQLMVADGKNLWYYDRELAQVTVKPIATALSSTPIMLLSSTPEQLRATFDIKPRGNREGLQWVQVKPHSAAADFSSAELAFDGTRLVRMLVRDNLGQTVRLDFQHAERNGALSQSLFEFKPPSGVDVIGTPH